MGHGLTSTDGMLSVRETPWHGLGVVLDTAPGSMAEAFRIAGMDWNPELVPVYFRQPDGTYAPAEGYAGIIRSDNRGVLGIRSDEYGAITHDAIARVGDGFLAQPGVNITTTGSLFGGRHGWALFEAGDAIAIPGDDSLIQSFLLLSWSHDGTRKFTVRNTAVRVVCNNTLTAALGSSVASFVVKHTKGAPTRVEAYAERVEALAAEMAEFSAKAAALASAPFTNADWRTLADALFPLPTDEEGKVLDGIRTERALNAQDALLDLRGGPTVAGPMADSAWGAWNAAVEAFDWLLGVEVNPDKRNLDAESQFLRTLGGGRDERKADALAVVAGIAGVSL